MITIFNVGDEVEITSRGKIDSISIGLNSSEKTEIRYGVVYMKPNGYVDHITVNEDKLMKLTKNLWCIAYVMQSYLVYSLVSDILFMMKEINKAIKSL